MNKIIVWWDARVLDYPYYRVTYPSGERTHPLYYSEAKGLAAVFGGRMWIDYDLQKRF